MRDAWKTLAIGFGAGLLGAAAMFAAAAGLNAARGPRRLEARSLDILDDAGRKVVMIDGEAAGGFIRFVRPGTKDGLLVLGLESHGPFVSLVNPATNERTIELDANAQSAMVRLFGPKGRTAVGLSSSSDGSGLVICDDGGNVRVDAITGNAGSLVRVLSPDGLTLGELPGEAMLGVIPGTLPSDDR